MLKQIALVCVAIFSFALASTVHAEEPLRISSMGIFVFPEYDQPGVLVQYQGTVPEKTALPRDISFLVPKGAGVAATCAIKADGNHTSETWKESDAGDGFVQVTYKLNEPRFHIEYYYNPLVGSPDKKMEFVFKATLPADEIDLAVQHPLKATNFVLNPDTPDSHKDDDGFTYHEYSFKQVAADARISTNIAYTKTDPSPSISGQKSAASASASSDGNSTLNQAIVVGIILGAIGIAGVYFLQRNARRVQPVAYRERPRAARQSARGESAGGFCTQCGNASDAEDKFCRRCGSPRAT